MMSPSRSAVHRSLVTVFDAVAEATVALSFSRVGIVLRRRLEAWDQPPTMEGRVVVVTGATSGIGLAAATALAALGATVHLVGRDATRARQARGAVEAAGHGPVHVDLVDMADSDAVAALATDLSEQYDRLDALIHNAGALTRSYQVTPAGDEVTVATQVLGPYVLTAKLAPLLWRTPRATIVTVSSGGMYAQRFDLDSLELTSTDYDGVVAYARAKRAQVVLAGAWAHRFASAQVASFAMHPGWVDTPGLQSALPRFRALWSPLLRTPDEGADTVVWLAAGGPAAESAALGVPATTSGFFHDRRHRSDHRFPLLRPTHSGDDDALLDWCAARTGIETPFPTMAAP
jgi:NAD(P)-dependent dehydrogenase (short-subunit alcohol dehydrogenase family)